MTDKEIIIKWKQGLSKEILSKIYKREFNRELRILRANPKHRHDGKYISNYESLKKIEKVIYEFLRNLWRERKKRRGVFKRNTYKNINKTLRKIKVLCKKT